MSRLYNPFLESVPIGIPDVLLHSRPVMDGEPVSAAVTNRLPGVNARNTAVLHDLVRRFRDLSGEYLWQMPIDQDVVIGDFVYFDAHAHAFKKGLARFETTEEGIFESDTSLVWGVVTNIRNGKADICTNGLCTFRVSSGAAYAAMSIPGTRFLSDVVPGGISDVAKRPFKCVGFLVGVKATGEVQFFVRSSLSVDPNMHQHKTYALAVERVTNIAEPGWLSADHPVFEGKQPPPGAVYGYNPNFLWGCGWPIHPPSKVSLRWQRTEESDPPLLASVPPEFYTMDETSIWWLAEETPPWNRSSNTQEYTQRLWLEVIGVGHAVETTVTTLRNKTPKGLSLRQHPYGGPAISGDLEIGLDLNLLEKEEPDGLGYAISQIAHNVPVEGREENNVLIKTPVVSKLRVDSQLFRARGQYSDAAGFQYGRIVLSDPTGFLGSEVPIAATHLNGVEETVIRDSVGLAFDREYPTSLLSQMAIPYLDFSCRMTVTVRLGILSLLPGTLSTTALQLTYRIIKNPERAGVAVPAFPQTEMAPLGLAALGGSQENTPANHGYYFLDSDPVEVSPGDIFILKIERRPPDGYAERIVLLRKSGLLGFMPE